MRIVIFRIATAIGDTLITFPILRELRAQYKDDHITLVSLPAILPLAKAWGLADEVIEPDASLWQELFSDEGITTPRWRNLFAQADLAISLMRNRTDQLVQNLRAAGAKEVIAALEFSFGHPTKHHMEYLAHSIGLNHLSADHVAPIIPRDQALHLDNAPVAVHPGCSNDERMWPAKKFAAVINHLLRVNQPVLLLAGPADTDALRDVRRHLKLPANQSLLNILSNAPILEVARQISRCKCYLGNDSGITHLAALLGVPTVLIMFPYFVIPQRPLGPVVDVIPQEKLPRIPVDLVLERVLQYV